MNEVAAAFGQFLLAIQRANIDSRWLMVRCHESDRPESVDVPERQSVLERMQGISLQVLTGLSDDDYFMMLKECELARELLDFDNAKEGGRRRQALMSKNHRSGHQLTPEEEKPLGES